MIAALSNCTSLPIRSFIDKVFFSTRNMSATRIHRQSSEVYGAYAMSERNVRKWVRDSKYGRGTLHDESRSGCPSVISDDLVALALHLGAFRGFTLTYLSRSVIDKTVPKVPVP